VLGLLVGRWWALVAAAGLGVWVAVSEEVELDGWFLGLLYALLAAVGIALGILTRRYAARLHNRPD
jgi:hypothetical protein